MTRIDKEFFFFLITLRCDAQSRSTTCRYSSCSGMSPRLLPHNNPLRTYLATGEAASSPARNLYKLWRIQIQRTKLYPLIFIMRNGCSCKILTEVLQRVVVSAYVIGLQKQRYAVDWIKRRESGSNSFCRYYWLAESRHAFDLARLREYMTQQPMTSVYAL